MGDAWQPQYWISPLGELGPDAVYFLVDLALPAKKIAVEVDGRSHRYSVEQDQRRDQWLRAQGWLVLRFSSPDIRTSVDAVVEQVRWHWLD